jgi:hypothetical protein
VPPFDLRPWLTCVDTTFRVGTEPRASTVDVADFDVHDEDDRGVLIRAQHPGLVAAIDDGVDEIVVHDEPMNPRLHLLVHEIVANQLAEGQPAVVRATARRLEREGHDRHEILHMIAGGVSGQLWAAIHDRSSADVDAYVAYLNGLPATWYDGLDDAGEPADDLTDVLGLPEDDGPAAALVRAMLDDGIDLQDESAVEAWIADFNAGPSAERDRVLGSSLGDIALPPVALPDDETLAASALTTAAMTQLAGFVTWLGDRRPLTQRGNLKLVDGKRLVGLLDTGDRFDETIRGRTVRTQSSTRLLGVDLVYRLAVASGLAQRQGAALRRTEEGASLATVTAASDHDADTGAAIDNAVAHPDAAAVLDPDDAEAVLDLWRTAVLELIGLGLVAAGRDDADGLRWWERTLNDGVVDLLAATLLTGEAMSVDLLVDDALEQLAEDYDLDALSESAREWLPDSVAWGMSELVDRLVWLGLVTRDDVRVELDLTDRARRYGGRIALTPLGTWFVRPLLIAQGVDVPVAGALVDADADELLDVVVDWLPDAFEAEVARWVAARPTAAAELAQAAQAAIEPDRMGLAFDALDIVGSEAEPAVRALADDPRCRPFVVAWLKANALAPLPADLGDPALELVRSLAVVLVSSGADAVADAAVADGVDPALVEQLWRVEDPWTTPVLETLGMGPHKRFSKAARRALFKRRNRN